MTTNTQHESHRWDARLAEAVHIPNAAHVRAEACRTCHTDVAATFRHALHALQGIDCEDCHGPGSLHVQGGGDVTKVISFRQRSAREANRVCLSCHEQDEPIRHWAAGPHASTDVRCTECHQIHAAGSQTTTHAGMNADTMTTGRVAGAQRVVPERQALVEARERANERCLTCHQTQRAQMSLPYHHPLREGKMGCVDCHNPHGGPAGDNLRMANAS
jgi:predicted CXXCH cytochrome family protein